MKQTIIRLFSLLLLGMVATGAQAGTWFKHFNVSLNSSPTGKGTVYVTLGDDARTYQKDDENGTITVDATINVNNTTDNNYNCKLWGFPKPGYKLVGFQKGESSIEAMSVVGGNEVTLEGGGSPTEQKKEDAQKQTATQYTYQAIFEETDLHVTADYYFKPLAGYQNNSFGSFSSEKSADGSKAILKAVPGDRMRFVGWHRTTGYSYNYDNVEPEQSIIVSTDLVYEVDNDPTKSEVYRPEFDLAPVPMPADCNMRTYCHKMGPRFDEQDVAEAYKVTSIENGILKMEKIKHIGPTEEGGHGVILKAPQGSEITLTYGYLNLGENVEDNKNNLLKGAEDGPVAANGKIYVLAKKKQGVGFYKLADGAEVPQGKAYLEIDDANNARDFFGFDDGTTTSISSVAEVEQPTPIYNMAGQRVSGSFSGLVIQNGRKYIRK